jgi:hypothetical protein
MGRVDAARHALIRRAQVPLEAVAVVIRGLPRLAIATLAVNPARKENGER